MSNESLRIPKELSSVKLFVQPAGEIAGSLFVSARGGGFARREHPLDLLNGPTKFVVVKPNDEDGVRIYNKQAIIRVECEDTEAPVAAAPPPDPLPCRFELSDGGRISGTLRRALPPDRARLLDHLNRTEEAFIELHVCDNIVCLVNKAHIISAATGAGEPAEAEKTEEERAQPPPEEVVDTDAQPPPEEAGDTDTTPPPEEPGDTDARQQ